MIAGSTLGVAQRALFVATILAGSFLLFLVQPMVARMALPRLGGAPAVWNSAMLVYQALLLGGYAYAHVLGRVPPRRQAAIHLAVLLIAALWLPLGLRTDELPAGVQPALSVPWLLGLSIGPLFLAISAQAPLIQRWFAAASGGQDPYRLYAASNLGSFAGLIAYPLLVEPAFPIRGQSLVWSVGYGVVVLLVAACAGFLPRSPDATRAANVVSEPAGVRRIAYWIALALVPSGLMLATSTYITTDIVAMPLLWVLPLGLYLLSFSIAFAGNRMLADVLTRIAPITILLFGGIVIGGYQARPYLNAALSLALLFMASVALHTALYRSRPEPDRLTGFYFAMSLGGALGGVFAALIAPLIFDWTYEYPILIIAAGLLVPQVFLTHGIRDIWQGGVQRRRVAMVCVLLVIATLVLLRLVGPAATFGEQRQGPIFVAIAAVGMVTIGAWLPYMAMLLASLALFGGYRAVALSFEPDARTRSYFGIYTVSDTPHQRELAHGTTVHGVQLTGAPARERTPTTYYSPGSGVGQALTMAQPLYGARARIGVVGLGTGTLACYARPGQRWTFYEIDPAIVRIARDTGQFTFLQRCLPTPRIVMGDARLSLAAEPAASVDILALDAFSSDAVPMHLLTTEAFATYSRVVSPRGVLMVHISNRFIDLRAVIAEAAHAGGWRALRILSTPSALEEGASSVEWIALTRDRDTAAILYTLGEDWQPLSRYPGFTAWSDDYSSILPLIRAP